MVLSLELSAPVQQKLSSLHMPNHDCMMQRGPAPVVLYLKSNLPVQQQYNNLYIPSPSRMMQRCLAMPVLGLKIRAPGQQKPHLADIPILYRNRQKSILCILKELCNPGMPNLLRPIQRGPVPVVPSPKISTPIQQQLSNSHMPKLGRMMQWRLAMPILSLEIRALIQQEHHLTDIPVTRRNK